jgi:hypothetical protein
MEWESQIRILLLMPYLEKGGVYPLGRWVLLRVRVEVRGRARGKRRRLGRSSPLAVGSRLVGIDASLELPFRLGLNSRVGRRSYNHIGSGYLMHIPRDDMYFP